GAQQRGQRNVLTDLSEWERVPGIGDRRAGKAAIARISGEKWPIAQVLPLRSAIGADPTGMSQPWNTDPLSDLQSLDSFADEVDPSDDLVTWNNRQQRIGQLAVDYVQVSATD